MLTDALVIARKECRDHLRDGRGLLSAALYTFMGPAVTALVAVASRDRAGQNALAAMAAVFAVMSAFTGGLGIAIDVMAGERERQSLLPLLLNPSSRGAIAAGKWLAAAAFAFVALLLNVAVFLAVLSHAHTIDPQTLARVGLAIGPLPALAGLAAALELVISTLSATTKEANAYTSIVTFLVMGLCFVAAVRRLPMLYRQTIILALEGLSYREMAEVLGIAESNVGARLTRARQALRTLMGRTS